MGEVFSVKLNPEQAQQADEARGGQSRSAWLRSLIEPVLSNGAEDNGHSGLPLADAGLPLAEALRAAQPPAPCPECRTLSRQNVILARQVDSLTAQVGALETAQQMKVMVPLDEDELDELDWSHG